MQNTPIPDGWDPRSPRPRIENYAAATEAFSWEEVRDELRQPPLECGFNAGAIAVDRICAMGNGSRTALRAIRRDGSTTELTYDDLRRQSNRFANLLASLGVGVGDAVFTLLGRVPDTFVATLGTLKNRSVICPLFSAFGPESARQRLDLGRARVLVTTRRLYERVVEGHRGALPKLEHVLLVDGAARPSALSLRDLMAQTDDEFAVPNTQPEDPAILHFTSGTTGPPKGVRHVHDAVVAHYATAGFALDLRPGDLFWCTADPGWVTGTSYGILAPLLHGTTNLVLEAEFDGERWYQTIEDHRVEILYTSPTAIRMWMKLGVDLPKRFDLSSLRLVSSVGEPLNPEAVVWGERVLGVPILDNWWQTETGGIMIANLRDQEIRLGSMGRALPGIEARIVRRLEDGTIEVIEQPDVEGEIALRMGWPSMMRDYLNRTERYAECFRSGWYLTEDLARRDADGYFWFVGRADDMIKTAGHRVGPFEIESVLMEHPAVAEAAAVGVPHPTAGEVVKAFVELKVGFDPSETLSRELIAFARQRLGPVAAPRSIGVEERLPKTRSGKIMRRLLRTKADPESRRESDAAPPTHAGSPA